jgi:hypothetical protein
MGSDNTRHMAIERVRARLEALVMANAAPRNKVMSRIRGRRRSDGGGMVKNER